MNCGLHAKRYVISRTGRVSIVGLIGAENAQGTRASDARNYMMHDRDRTTLLRRWINYHSFLWEVRREAWRQYRHMILANRRNAKLRWMT